MRRPFVLLACFVCSGLAGRLNADVTNVWALSNSPVIVDANVVVSSGTTLLIEPGVTVMLAPGINITVADGGRLLAEATSNAPILFTRSGASGNWGHFTVNGSAGSPETRITYARFLYNAASSTTPCIRVSAGTVYFGHLTFGNTAAPYIWVDGASFYISHCYFPPPATQFEPCHGTLGIKTGGRGVFYRNYFGKPIGYNDVVDFTGGNRPGQPLVHFIENVFAGGDDDGLDLDGTDAWVEGNIFLHFHKNGNTPDSSSGVSSGSDSGNTSEVTLVRNVFYDCDQAVMAKQGCFYTLLNNTVVHQSHAGGLDTTGAVMCVKDQNVPEGAGMYFEGNIIYDAEQLTRNVTNAVVTFTNNLMPFAWSGPGGGNSTNDPVLQYVPPLAATYFTNWDDAQIIRQWFDLRPESPGINTGPNGRNRGAIVPPGASLAGAATGSTTASNATIIVGSGAAGHGIPTTGWPAGAGFTHYRWRLDHASWSAETPIATPITLANLLPGQHDVEVSGRMDSGLYQDDPALGEAAGVTRSSTWTVSAVPVLSIHSLAPSNAVEIQFDAQADTVYSIECRDSTLSGAWQHLITVDAEPAPSVVTYTDALQPGAAARFYRLKVE